MNYGNKLYKYPCDNPVSCFPSEVTLPRGQYRIECWGASGGNSNARGGRGAYVSGIITFSTITRLFLFIGAEGHTILGKTSFNGGGRSHLSSSHESQGASGGGSTDVRIMNRTDLLGLTSRIIVASGGGGAESYSTGATGGFGGTLIGQSGATAIKPNTGNRLMEPTGGTQVSGGDAGKCLLNFGQVCPSEFVSFPGEFGHGGNASLYSYGGGGGGGYFGGGGGCLASCMVSSGAGGSSFISGCIGCHSFKTLNNKDLIEINNSIHYSGHIFRNILFQSGDEEIKSPTGLKEIGHSGPGAIKITFIGPITSSVGQINVILHVMFFISISIIGS